MLQAYLLYIQLHSLNFYHFKPIYICQCITIKSLQGKKNTTVYAHMHSYVMYIYMYMIHLRANIC